MVRMLAVGCLVAVAALGWGQAVSLDIRFDSSGPRLVWIADRLGPEPPRDGIEVEGESYQLPLGGAAERERVFVWDRRRNKVAQRPAREPGRVWTVRGEDYNRIAELVVRVEHRGQPVAAAAVELKDAEATHTVILDPNREGEIVFFGIKPGEVEVKVRYASGLETKETPVQIVRLDEEDRAPRIVVAVADEVATVGATASGAESAPEAGPPINVPEPARVQWWGSLLGYVIALGAALGAGYFILQYVRRNQETVAERLEKLGVAIPGQSEPDDDSSADPPVLLKAPEPPAPIVLPDAAPTPVVAPMTAGGGGEPRLVLPDGTTFPLGEGTHSVGRAEDCDLCFSGESSVSRRHAEFVVASGRIQVRDVGSTNGTFVNDRRIEKLTDLHLGDTVQFGAVRARIEGQG